MNTIDVDRRLRLSAVSLAVAGVLFFFYGLFTSNTQFSVSPTDMSASILPSIVKDSASYIQVRDAVTENSSAVFGVLFAAMILIVAAAALDVWRRLFLLHHSDGIEGSPKV
ncbi:MAG TPA: hypothetical protein VJB82_00705 [Candidatus Peribacterales bacterium]|nr:hypothetical protein [Candidatus Peribacterales bacterium]